MRLIAAALLLLPFAAPAADQRLHVDGIEFSIGPRPPEGIRAFYLARGFPRVAVDAIASTCLLGVGIRNTRPDTLWLELANWRFTDGAGREVRRITRPDWETRWQALDVPPAARATFGWTQLPEVRDLQPDEPVGGNVAIEPVAGEIVLAARFRTGSGPLIEIRVAGLRCPDTGPAP